MPKMEPHELNAKAMIAAALIQIREVDVTLQDTDAHDSWSHHEGLRRLHLLTNLVYDEISSERRP